MSDSEFKKGDEIIAIKDSDHGHYKKGEVFIYDHKKEKSDHAWMISLNNKPVYYIIKNFALKKEKEFNSDMKDLLK